MEIWIFSTLLRDAIEKVAVERAQGRLQVDDYSVFNCQVSRQSVQTAQKVTMSLLILEDKTSHRREHMTRH